jgi:cysteine rich repeat protein
MLTMVKNFVIIGAALLLFGSTALAQSRARACVDDIKKLCASVQPGEGRVAGCVKEHLKDLSPPCQNLIAQAAVAAKACAADLKQQCADARRRVAKITCVKSALANLSDDCKSAVSQVASGRK